VCVCAFSLHRESPGRILGDKPLLFRGVLSQLASEQGRGKTYTEASKNCNNVVGEECSVYEYTQEFKNLAQYGGHHVHTNVKKVKLFHKGLTIQLQDCLILS
jgi:hypothetical protein